MKDGKLSVNIGFSTIIPFAIGFQITSCFINLQGVVYQKSIKNFILVWILEFPKTPKIGNLIVSFNNLKKGLYFYNCRSGQCLPLTRNPKDGSFTSLIIQIRLDAKGPNLRFTLYWAGLLSQRRELSTVSQFIIKMGISQILKGKNEMSFTKSSKHCWAVSVFLHYFSLSKMSKATQY